MMFKRSLTILMFLFALGLSLSLQAPTAHAQDQTYFTYVSFWAVPRAQWAAFDKERDQANATLQRLVTDGTIVSWGDSADYVHGEAGYTHEDWFMATSRANILKALELLRAGSTGPAFSAVTKHQDYFLRTLAHGGKTSPVTTGYIRVAMWQAKPDEGQAFEAHFMKYLKPALDADVASGAILMYNFDVEDIHTGAPGRFNLAIVYPNGEAIDSFYTNLAEAGKQNPAVGEMIDSLTISKEHRDLFSKVTAYQHK
jgi:hypothetical protein